MQPDPFGNLRDWGPALEKICQLADEGNLSDCQSGLTRILRYRDNWRLREEALLRIGKINTPEDPMVRQILNIIEDERLYYDVRILACQTMAELMKNSSGRFYAATETDILNVVKVLSSTPQPPIFEQALKKLYSVGREKFCVV
ncbi:hypothetical protein [Desulforhopalus sp. IMCC35007]|uniref:hypothetical protein n=1 Tax=Desulforhopalus sp. IMCC35007 TaxID=2569543 RepID=UPI0010AE05AD|nr:hypothetical protein [Desulforhopalus sp. IMCC35007]TKB09649.1 hypothetical protein FCL48_09370 [Desulforhopalus sp. IMCC35007]